MSKDIRVRAAGIMVHNDRILLNKFEKDGVVKYYNIVGGGLEDNETLKSAVKREIKEESGVDVEVGDLLFCSNMSLILITLYMEIGIGYLPFLSVS